MIEDDVFRFILPLSEGIETVLKKNAGKNAGRNAGKNVGRNVGKNAGANHPDVEEST